MEVVEKLILILSVHLVHLSFIKINNETVMVIVTFESNSKDS